MNSRWKSQKIDLPSGPKTIQILKVKSLEDGDKLRNRNRKALIFTRILLGKSFVSGRGPLGHPLYKAHPDEYELWKVDSLNVEDILEIAKFLGFPDPAYCEKMDKMFDELRGLLKSFDPRVFVPKLVHPIGLEMQVLGENIAIESEEAKSVVDFNLKFFRNSSTKKAYVSSLISTLVDKQFIRIGVM